MKFHFYRADSDYCDFLRIKDPCVPYTMDKKSTRPFVGIVFSLNGYEYYAPLTSPKPKHLNMKNQIDFLKIDGGVLGAINLNNMIPIHSSSLQLINVKIMDSDSEDEVQYKNLLINQLSWCNRVHNSLNIIEKATKLYSTITKGEANAKLKSRCCNFLLDEEQYLIYCKIHNL
nr:MAG TPA: Toxin ToxN, type III toxin-antitoxin system [Caudoviricetes sp.]